MANKTIDREKVKQIINEQYNPATMIKISDNFSIKKTINSLVENCSANKELMSLLETYDKSINEDVPEILLYESFMNDLSNYTTQGKVIKNAYNSLVENLKANAYDYTAMRLYEGVSDQLKDFIKVPFANYLNEKSEANRAALAESLSTVEIAGDMCIAKLSSLVNESALYGVHTMQNQMPVIGMIHESEDIASKLSKNAKVEINDELIDKICETVNENLSQSIEENEKPHGLAAMISSNGVNLMESINSLKANRYAMNQEHLAEIVETYEDALNNGAIEERLYETFINHVSPYTSYINGVSGTLDDLKTRVENNRVNIDLTKILASMMDTSSYYIVPVIEDDVQRYVDLKTPANRIQLLNALYSFAGDPYVAQMIELVNMDMSRDDIVGESKVISMKDRMKFIKENTTLSPVYSPVQFIKEGECIFNVNGTYYMKAGTSISRLPISNIKDLNESFIALCQLVNDDRVKIQDKSIILESDNMKAEIFEKFAKVNGSKETKESLRDLHKMFEKYSGYDREFFIMTSCLLENFNRIALVDFVKHVESNDQNSTVSADIFRLNENIFIAAHNDAINEHTFYKNVNPIQCRSILNEHMHMNVSDLFEDLLPNQDKILSQINEADTNYESAIKKYEDSLAKLKDAEKDLEGADLKKVQSKIEEISAKLEDIRIEYKEWQGKAEGMLNDKDNPDETDTEEPEDKDEESTADRPLSDKEVEDQKDELSTPIEGGAPGTDIDAQEQGSSLEDDISAVMQDYTNFNEEDEDPENDIQDIQIEDGSSDDYDFSFMNTDDSSDDATLSDDKYNADMFADDLDSNSDSKDDGRFKIVDVSFNRNIANDSVQRTGKVHVLVPSVDPQGNINNDIREFNFTIDANNFVTIDNDDYVALDIYNAIVDEVESSEYYQEALKSDVLTPVQSGSYADMDPDVEDFGISADDFFEDVPVEDATELDYGEDDLDNNFTLDDIDDSNESVDDEPQTSIKDEISDEPQTGSETANDPVPVVADESGTEYELPAKNTDKSVIPESFIGISAEFGKKLSKKKVMKLDEKMVLGEDEDSDSDAEDLSEPEVAMKEITTDDMFEMMHEVSTSAADAAQEDEINAEVSEIDSVQISLTESDDEDLSVEFFNISSIDEDDEDDSVNTTIYKLNDTIYEMAQEDFEAIINDDEMTGDEIVEALTATESDATGKNTEACIELVTSVFTSATGDSYNIEEDCQKFIDDLQGEVSESDDFFLDESVKIKKSTKVKADKEKDSVKADEIENGTHQEQEHQKSEEDAQAAQQDKKNESFKPVIPNHSPQDMNEHYGFEKREFQVGDRVMYKPLNTKAQIHSMEQDGTFDLILLDGLCVSGVTKKQMELLTDVNVDAPKQFNFDKDNLTRDLSNYPDGKHQDLNKRVPGNIVVDGFKLNNESCQVLLKDVMSNGMIHAINEYGIDSAYPRDNVIIEPVEEAEWPWVIYTTDEVDAEPERKVQANPQSFLAAMNDEDRVECKMNGENVLIAKKYLKMIA